MHSQNTLFLDETQAGSGEGRHTILPSPTVAPVRDVFAEAMLEQSSTHRRRSPLDWAVSLAIHAGVVAVLVMLPLYFTTGLDIQKLNLTFLAAPPSAPTPPPPPLAAAAVPRVTPKVPERNYVSGKLTAPSFVPRVIAPTPSGASVPDVVVAGVPGGIAGGQMGGAIGGVLGGTMGNVPPPAPPVAEAPKQPVRVGGNVKPPRLIYNPQPVYPLLARQAGIFGEVVIDAIIDEHGNVSGMRALSGPPLLVPAALSAVSKRKYEPTILDGAATPIDLRVEITFSLG